MASNLYIHEGTIADGIFTVTNNYLAMPWLFSVGQDASEDGILQVQEGFKIIEGEVSFSVTYLGTVPGGIAFTLSGTTLILVAQQGLPLGTELTVSAVDYDPANPPVVPCFLAGTRIDTARGSVAVEDLVEGDQLKTLSGRFAPLTWIGHRKVSARLAQTSPKTSLPIRFAAGAFAPGLPVRDLWLSPDHCLHHDGVLIEAKALVNGTSVTQAHPGREICYYHLLLDRHEVVFAEGLAAESYRPSNNTFGFQNAESFPAGTARDLPQAAFPQKWSGAKVEALRAQLRARAGEAALTAERAA